MVQAGIFLDRDGVINEVLSKRIKFVNQPDDFYLLPGVGEAIHLLNKTGYLVFVVTNQGGVGLGYMKERTLKEIHTKMKDDLQKDHAYITDIAYCSHRPDEGCLCRKPKPNMIIHLAQKHHVDVKNSYMVGDRLPDIEAGKNAGCKTVHISGQSKVNADYVFPDLLTFVRWLITSESS